MDLARFRRLLDAYGADRRRWPSAEREAAEELIAASDEARRAWREAAPLDDALGRAGVGVDEASIARVLGALEATPPPAPPLPPAAPRRARNWTPPVFLGAMALLGFIIGTMEAVSEADAAPDFDLVALAFTPGFAGGMGL